MKVDLVWTVMSLAHPVVVQYFGHTFIVNLHVLLSWSFDNRMKDFPERLLRRRSMSDWKLEKPFIELKVCIRLSGTIDHYFRHNESAFT